jgi:hypothetical protein
MASEMMNISLISSRVLPVAELCNERRLSQLSLPELSCSWLASCDLHRRRTCSLCVPIDSQPEWLYIPLFPPFPAIRCPCRLHSQADIATIFLVQDDIRQGFPCGSLRLFSKSTMFVFQLSLTLDYLAAPRHINP